MAEIIHLLLGGNQGHVQKTFTQTIKKIERKIGIVVRQSSIYKTEAWGVQNQPDYLNMVLKVNTSLTPKETLAKCLAIEEELGRVRSERYAPRKIDIDILFFGQQMIATPGLTIPHPQIAKRRFALVPLNEISYHKKHPVLKKTIHHLLTICTDRLQVHKIA